MSDETPVEDVLDEDAPVDDWGTTDFVDAPSDDFEDVEGAGV